MPSMAPLSLLVAWPIAWTLESGRRRRTAGLAVLTFGVAMMVRSGSIPRAIDATRWDARHLFGRLDRAAYLERFRSRYAQAFSAGDNERLAAHLHARSEPQDRVVVFGVAAGVYFLTRLLPATRLSCAYAPASRSID